MAHGRLTVCHFCFEKIGVKVSRAELVPARWPQKVL